jgi:hypothetical protein
VPHADNADELDSDELYQYLVPYWGARACAALAIVIRAGMRTGELTQDELADVAYEHYCAVEDVEALMAILEEGRHGAGSSPAVEETD